MDYWMDLNQEQIFFASKSNHFCSHQLPVFKLRICSGEFIEAYEISVKYTGICGLTYAISMSLEPKIRKVFIASRSDCKMHSNKAWKHEIQH